MLFFTKLNVFGEIQIRCLLKISSRSHFNSFLRSKDQNFKPLTGSRGGHWAGTFTLLLELGQGTFPPSPGHWTGTYI